MTEEVVGDKVGEGDGVVATGGDGVSEVGFGGIIELDDEETEGCWVNIGGRGGLKVLKKLDDDRGFADPELDNEVGALAELETGEDDEWLVEEAIDENCTGGELDIDPTDCGDIIAEENCCVPDPILREDTDSEGLTVTITDGGVLVETELNEPTAPEDIRLGIGILEELEGEAVKVPSVLPGDTKEGILDAGVSDDTPMDVNACACEEEPDKPENCEFELNDREGNEAACVVKLLLVPVPNV
jgi:hypothetical protein